MSSNFKAHLSARSELLAPCSLLSIPFTTCIKGPSQHRSRTLHIARRAQSQDEAMYEVGLLLPRRRVNRPPVFSLRLKESLHCQEICSLNAELQTSEPAESRVAIETRHCKHARARQHDCSDTCSFGVYVTGNWRLASLDNGAWNNPIVLE